MVPGDVAGPSSGLIRRPGERPAEMAELYARLQTVEDRTDTVVDATRVTLQEVRGEMARLDSNQDTQKKYILKQLVEVDELAKTALEKTAAVHEPLHTIRHQTPPIHPPLPSLHP